MKRKTRKKYPFEVQVAGRSNLVLATSAGNAARLAFRRVIANEYDDKGQIIRTLERPLANQPASELDGTFSRCDVRIIPARHYAGRKTGFMDYLANLFTKATA